MKRLLAIVFLCPFLIYGQINLCRDCAITIYDYRDLTKCCEECLQETYLSQLRKNITRGGLYGYYSYEHWLSLLPLPDTISAQFLVHKIEKRQGYCLSDSGLCRSTYYLINLECDSSCLIREGSSIVLVVNDSTLFDINHYYNLTISPYFKKNQDFKNIDGKIVQIIGSHTLFDLVYKNWLVVKLPLRKNYFFLISTSTD